jgi:hypothetical protein
MNKEEFKVELINGVTEYVKCDGCSLDKDVFYFFNIEKQDGEEDKEHNVGFFNWDYVKSVIRK